jgi:hypothetical protein
LSKGERKQSESRPPSSEAVSSPSSSDDSHGHRPILALNLGKYKSVAWAYDRATAQVAIDTITTSRAAC